MQRLSIVTSAIVLVALLAAASHAGAVPPGPRVQVAGDILRFAGDTPYETAADAMAEAFPAGARTVVIGNGTRQGCVDGQLGVPLAGAVNGPLLFTDPAHLDTATADAIVSMGATKALVVGGTEMISTSVESELASLGLSVQRVGGADIYEDAAAVAVMTRDRAGIDFVNKAFLVVDEPSVDWRAMYAVGPNADYNRIPILFTHYASVPTATLAAMTAAGIDRVSVLGSDAYVSDAVLDQLTDLGLTADRMTETSRNGLGEAVVEYNLRHG